MVGPCRLDAVPRGCCEGSDHGIRTDEEGGGDEALMVVEGPVTRRDHPGKDEHPVPAQARPDGRARHAERQQLGQGSQAHLRSQEVVETVGHRFSVPLGASPSGPASWTVDDGANVSTLWTPRQPLLLCPATRAAGCGTEGGSERGSSGSIIDPELTRSLPRPAPR